MNKFVLSSRQLKRTAFYHLAELPAGVTFKFRGFEFKTVLNLPYNLAEMNIIHQPKVEVFNKTQEKIEYLPVKTSVQII